VIDILDRYGHVDSATVGVAPQGVLRADHDAASMVATR
jgi:hypothetical protein